MPRPRNTDHGTYMRYAIDRCRCDVCVSWKRDSDRDYRARRRAAAPEPPMTEMQARAYALRDALLRKRSAPDALTRTNDAQSGDFERERFEG